MINSYQVAADVIETEKNQNQEITTNNKATTEDTGKETSESSFSEKDNDGVESTSVNETNVSETDTAEEDSSKESRNGDETSEQTKTTESQTTSSSPQANNSNPSSANEVDQVIQDAAIQDIASGTAGTAPWRIDSNGVLHIGAGQLEDNVMNLWGGYLETIKEIVFEGNVIAGLSLRSFFDGMINLTAIQNLDRLDTSNVRDMYRMFINTHSLSSVDVSNFNTRQVKDMSEMFYGTGIEALDLSSFDTSQVTNMNGMFFLSNVKQVNLANFDTSQVTDMGSMFSRANFTSIDVSSFETSQVTNMSAMFDRAGEVSSLNLSNFDTSQVRDMRYMFNGLAELASLDVSSFDTTQVQNMASMFTGTQSLTNINLSSFDTSVVKNMDNMFEGIGVSSLDVSTFDTSQVTSMTAMFRNAANITDLDLSNFNTSNVIGFSLMFAGMTNLVSLDLSSFDTSKEFGYLSAMFDGATMLKQLKLGTNIKKLYPVAALPAIPVSNMYTGYWQNVGSGTVDNPKGTTILTSADLLRTYAGGTMADTYVWQKQASASIQVHDSTIYTGDSWQEEDNFDGALDKDGNPVDFQDITVEGNVDTNTPGTYQVNYRYDGVTSTATITVKTNQTAVNVHDSTIYVGDSWQAEDNFDSVLDKDGNPVAFQDVTVEGSVDTNTSGTYQVNYRYDGVTSTATITVKANQTAVNVHDSTIYVGDNWEAEDNFDSALDKDGNSVDFQDITVDTSKADTSKAGSFEVTYTYDGVTSTAIITVKEKQTAVNVHDSTIYVGDNWEAEDNFDSALDKDGNSIDFQDLTVDTSKADTSKAGSFKVTYTYDGVTSTAIITVKEKQTAVNVHDSTIYVGDNWEAKDNFDSALDKDGNSVDFQDLTIDASQADTSKAGTFEVTYTYDGITSTAIITVKEKMTAVNVHDSTIYVGDNWEAEDNFDSTLDKDGNDVALSDLTVDASKADTSKAGSFEVTYMYDGVTSTAIVTVKEKRTAVNVHDSTIYVGDNWEAEDNFDSALDKDGNDVALSDLTVDASKADTSKSGSFEVTYTFDGVTSTAIVTVKEKRTAVNVHNSTIYVGDNWEAEDNFDSALDKDGNDVALSDLTVDASKADTSKAGSFEVTYTYDGVTSIAIVTVKEKMTAVNVHDSTIYVGDNWEAEDNFDSALDKAGNDVALSDLTVDVSKADTSKAGSFEVTYMYDGVTSTATITVKEKMTAVNVHDSTIYVGDNWQAEDNFDSALDKDGNDVDFSSITVDASKAETNKVGSFEVTYTYDGVTSTATITVKEKMTAVNVHDSTLYVGDNWQADDNFDSALDKDGNSVDFQDLTIDASQADTSKAGSFEVTYTYDGVTSTAVVTVKEKQTAVNVHDSTIYVGDSWEAEDNFDSALDKDGTDVALSDLTIDASEADTSKSGSFEITYTYDGVTSIAIITVKEKMTAVNVHDSTLYVGDNWEAEDNFDGALDKDGNDVALSDLTVDASQSDTSKSGSFKVTYTYDGITSTATITVKEKMTAVNVHDSTIYVGDNWEVEGNFDGALDKDGNSVDFQDLTIDASQADTSKSGSFEVTYTYDGVTSTAIITVKEKMTAINVHDSTIYVGDSWEAEDNFDSALDKDGSDVALSNLTVDASQADTSKSGSFKVTYTYDGVTSTAIVMVKEKMTAVNVHDSTIYVGDKWTAKENFDNALDKAGKKVVYEDLTVDASQVDTSKAGSYEVSYSYDGITVTAIVTVKEKFSQEKPADDSTHTTSEQEKENRKKITSDSKKQVTLPKTNETKSVVELVAGVIIVLLTGVIFFWKKRKANKV
ncbi:bacterial Ig-like domain-containing protein [Enterococcus casseliflavus]|uniref:bacterial Ig-like domain-containing protein n=1 Tax=Enterococcus casseliflavus TaxID=37734 RepID=UPI0039A40E11